MDVKMHTIKAGPDGCADAGDIISLPDDQAKRLIDGKFAVQASRPARETAMIDPVRQEQIERERARAQAEEEAEKEAERKSAASIGPALDRLDPDDDDDWTSAGKPAMDRVKDLTGSKTLTRAELDTLYPEFRRPAVTPAPDPSTAVKNAEPKASSAARSNRP